MSRITPHGPISAFGIAELQTRTAVIKLSENITALENRKISGGGASFDLPIITMPVYVIGKDASGTIGWVATVTHSSQHPVII